MSNIAALINASNHDSNFILHVERGTGAITSLLEGLDAAGLNTKYLAAGHLSVTDFVRTFTDSRGVVRTELTDALTANEVVLIDDIEFADADVRELVRTVFETRTINGLPVDHVRFVVTTADDSEATKDLVAELFAAGRTYVIY